MRVGVHSHPHPRPHPHPHLHCSYSARPRLSEIDIRQSSDLSGVSWGWANLAQLSSAVAAWGLPEEKYTHNFTSQQRRVSVVLEVGCMLVRVHAVKLTYPR